MKIAFNYCPVTDEGLFKFKGRKVQGYGNVMRDKDILPLTREERIGITLAEDRIRDERKRRKGLQFPKNAPRHDSLLQLADEVSTAWCKEVGQVLKRK